MTVPAGERDAVRIAEGEGESIGDRDPDAAADMENDIFVEVDAEIDLDDVQLKFDDAELKAVSSADRLGVSNVLGDSECFGDFESEYIDEGDAESRGTAVNVGVASGLSVIVS